MNRYRIYYRDEDPGSPTFTSIYRGYDARHAEERFVEAPHGEGWLVVKVERADKARRALFLTVLAALLTAGSAFAAQPAPKKPRVQPQKVVTVKVMPAATYAAKAQGAAYVLSTVTDTTCTAWVAPTARLEDEVRAYRACATKLDEINRVP